ncbi:hypothetical protein [Actinoplanes sp. NBRC 103695]|uniref:hypothetical protein n=1 Tax=Actinoplanes sp. NBRC 103695 TaxID=3032202 RepID=UPI0024A11393|nr:hypothetical protein [Actinoplanes sp. NBRC 103695]GLZ00578.1 hypothetical protein Acsp02_78300 [Actinoplanes sp. NBRC 103695]
MPDNKRTPKTTETSKVTTERTVTERYVSRRITVHGARDRAHALQILAAKGIHIDPADSTSRERRS